MHAIAWVVGPLLVLGTLLDGFETILLPRRINRRFRYSRMYYRAAWWAWRRLALGLPVGRWREATLSAFGPLSMLGLFGAWITSLVVGFAAVQWAVAAGRLAGGFGADLYFSGTTFFTLGLGDLTPTGGLARVLTVAEAGLGFGFLAVIIAYLPVLYQAFSRREVTISLLDARAGSPPAGGEAVLRLARDGPPDPAAVDALLREWEQWSAELLESHISFPVLGYYRSQHANQSWLAALATMLDAAAVLLATRPAGRSHQAGLTFAMARHAAVDLTLVFGIRPRPPAADRLSAEAWRRLHGRLHAAGDPAATGARLTELRGVYEPFLAGLAAHFLLVLPAVVTDGATADNWQRSASMPQALGIARPPQGRGGRDHFD